MTGASPAPTCVMYPNYSETQCGAPAVMTLQATCANGHAGPRGAVCHDCAVILGQTANVWCLQCDACGHRHVRVTVKLGELGNGQG